MLYNLGRLALIVVLVYLFRLVAIYIGRAPARGKGIPPEAMRYFNELERIVYPIRKDKNVIECMMAANQELRSQYSSFEAGTHREYPNALFGPDSFNNNREEVWAIWVLLNYSNRSVLIDNMKDRLLKRMKELSENEIARPRILFEDCRPYQEYIAKCYKRE